MSSSSYASLILILTLALVAVTTDIPFAVAQTDKNCGSGRIPAGNPNFRSDVKTVVDSLGEEASRTQFQLARSPNNAVGAAAGAAICYSRVAADCRACFNKGKAILPSCNSTTGMFNGGVCALVFWRIFD